jgi:excinuclease ABC subunit C
MAVGSMVSFDEGQPDKNGYRRFRIKTVAGQDDFGMMFEVLRRRFERAKRENVYPDLLIVDGGTLQARAALAILDGMEITELPVIGLAKENEEVFTRDRASGRSTADPMILPRASQAMYLVQRIRDEAHRFAITYHRQVRQRSGLRSALDEVAGIGPKRKRELLRRFGSVKGIRSATLEEIAAVPGMNLKTARLLKTAL